MAPPIPIVVLPKQLGCTETWSAQVAVDNDGAVHIHILEDSQNLIDLLETYGTGVLWGVLDLEFVPLDAAASKAYYLSDPVIVTDIMDPTIKLGVGFDLHLGGVANGAGHFFVKAVKPHSKKL